MLPEERASTHPFVRTSFLPNPWTKLDKTSYFMLCGRISKNIGENIFRSYTGNTSENTDFHVLVA